MLLRILLEDIDILSEYSISVRKASREHSLPQKSSLPIFREDYALYFLGLCRLLYVRRHSTSPNILA